MIKFAIILGEPNSINSEILAKSIATKKKCRIIGSYELIKLQLKTLKIRKKIEKIQSINNLSFKEKKLRILDIPLKFEKPFSVDPKRSAVYIKKCFHIAHKLCLKKKLNGFINCAIDKKNLFKNQNIGVTEFLAKKNKIFNSEVMMIYNKHLSVVPLTTHIRIRSISKFIKKDIIKKKLKTLNNFYLKYFKKKPRIAVLGLNPHNLESRFNSEESKIIAPVIKSLKTKLKISGPYSSDMIFLKNNYKKFDVIVGMYHDQVLAPFKAIFQFDAINITLGLPYLRISPDHGTAKDKIKLNLSNPESLNKCIKTISELIK